MEKVVDVPVSGITDEEEEVGESMLFVLGSSTVELREANATAQRVKPRAMNGIAYSRMRRRPMRSIA